MTLIRRPDWRTRLDALIDEIRALPFEWGRHDCGVGLAARVVAALTGADLAADHVGAYDSPEGAAALVKRLGHGDFADLVATLLPEIPPAFARIGDLVALPVPGPLGHGLGVVVGERILTLTPRGIGSVDRLRADRGFMVG